MKLSRILCIDGAKALERDYLVGLADAGGFTTRFCWTPEQALRSAREMRPDLILLADSVGDVRCLELLAELADLDPGVARTPVVIVCAVRDTFKRIREAHPTVVGWLRRPFDPMNLAEDVRRAWSRLEESEYFS